MKDVYAIRRKNLQRLCDENAHSNQSELARLLDISNVSLVNRYLRGKNIGKAMAREIESKANKEPGWMDNDHEVKSHVYDRPISEEEANFGRDWGQLQEPQRSAIQEQVQLLVAAQKRASKAAPAKASPKKASHRTKQRRDGHQPRTS